MPAPSIFTLGATGYLGSEFLLCLAQEHPPFPVAAFLRHAMPDLVALINAIHSDIRIVEGLLNDGPIIQRKTERACTIMNSASSDHWPSVRCWNSARKPGRPPLYIHVSGCGIIADEARKQAVDSVKEWSDIGLDLKERPPTNTHMESDIQIVEAGPREDIPVRTIIIYPARIHGVGEGLQRTTSWLRIFLDVARKVSHADTWGPGANSMNNIHVKDAASAMLTVFEVALENGADEGAEGLSWKLSGDWTKVMGDVLFARGIVKEAGARPMPTEVVDPLDAVILPVMTLVLAHADGWLSLASNQFFRPDRLTRLAWSPVHSAKTSLSESLTAAIEHALVL